MKDNEMTNALELTEQLSAALLETGKVGYPYPPIFLDLCLKTQICPLCRRQTKSISPTSCCCPRCYGKYYAFKRSHRELTDIYSLYTAHWTVNTRNRLEFCRLYENVRQTTRNTNAIPQMEHYYHLKVSELEIHQKIYWLDVELNNGINIRRNQEEKERLQKALERDKKVIKIITTALNNIQIYR